MKVRIGKMLVVSVATLLVTCGVAFATEVTWSVVHPTELDLAYMARVAEKAVEYSGVDSFLWCRIAAAFDAVTEVDGYVLTLTGADFSVIHNSNAERCPSVKVVERTARVFAEECEKHGKRFVIRLFFGSVAKDYEDIIAGLFSAVKDGKGHPCVVSFALVCGKGRDGSSCC